MSEKVYVPILKWKKGEQEALKNLTSEQISKIIPLIEITDIQEPREFSQVISDCFNAPIYIDTLLAAEDDRDYLFELTYELKKNGNIAFPVLYYDDLPDNLAMFTPEINHFAVKIPIPEDIDGPGYTEMFSIIKRLKKDSISFDIILDLDFVHNGTEASRQLSEVRNVLNGFLLDKDFYDSIIISATSFPKNLSDLEAGETKIFPRYDFKIFQKVITTPSLQKLVPKLLYSDYGVTKFTDTEIDFSKLRYGPLPKLKYTTESQYIVLKGKKNHATKKMIKSYVDLAKEIFYAPYYFGEDFSFGDLEIKERALALNNKGPGNNTNWVTIAANHHIAVVVEQFSKSDAI